MLDNLRQDLSRLAEIKGRPRWRALVEGLLFENGFQAVVLHRLAHGFRRRGVPVLGPGIARLSLFLTGVDISPGAVIGPGLYVAHGVGLVVGGGVRIGARGFLLGGVSLGAPSQARLAQMPELGDDVFVGAGARVLGRIRVGSRVVVGANAVVTRDVPDDCKVVSAAGVEVIPLAARSAPEPRA
jgi:serine O-acetyltransferase